MDDTDWLSKLRRDYNAIISGGSHAPSVEPLEHRITELVTLGELNNNDRRDVKHRHLNYNAGYGATASDLSEESRSISGSENYGLSYDARHRVKQVLRESRFDFPTTNPSNNNNDGTPQITSMWHIDNGHMSFKSNNSRNAGSFSSDNEKASYQYRHDTVSIPHYEQNSLLSMPQRNFVSVSQADYQSLHRELSEKGVALMEARQEVSRLLAANQSENLHREESEQRFRLRISELEIMIASLNSNISVYRDRNAIFEKELTSLTHFKLEFGKLENEKKSAEASATALKSRLDDQSSYLNEVIRAFESSKFNIVSLQSEINDLHITCSKAQSQIDGYITDIQSLQETITEKEETIAKLHSDTAAQRLQTIETEGYLDHAKSNIESLSRKIDSRERRLREVVSELEQVVLENRRLKAEIKSLRQQSNSMEGNILEEKQRAILESRRLEEQLPALQNEISTLRMILQSKGFSNHHNSPKDEVMALKKRVHQLSMSLDDANARLIDFDSVKQSALVALNDLVESKARESKVISDLESLKIKVREVSDSKDAELGKLISETSSVKRDLIRKDGLIKQLYEELQKAYSSSIKPVNKNSTAVNSSTSVENFPNIKKCLQAARIRIEELEKINEELEQTLVSMEGRLEMSGINVNSICDTNTLDNNDSPLRTSSLRNNNATTHTSVSSSDHYRACRGRRRVLHCFRDMRGLLKLIIDSLEGRSPDMSLMLGAPLAESFSFSSSVSEDADWLRIENEIQIISQELKNVRNSMTDRYAENIGRQCVIQ